ncbi:transcriptional regulator [Streptococcus sp. 121]|uniref:transcriptional regulator n=1 Tax=Streptococcus sp. 121 TaxID=2797637 RepID=UPI0018F0CE44|nr:transcriptional regulator [Streptococcus sp. 121]MBJ6745544.1 transcriptional regulator [Streptococcus sp. 121]
MSQQHQKWLELVKQKMEQKSWSKSDLAQVCGVTLAMITRLLNEGHGSDNFKLLVSKKLNIRESWTTLEEN